MKTYNIPIFVPHLGCPYECVFCNQRRITAQAKSANPEMAQNIIEDCLKTINRSDTRIEIAFFGGSFTAIDVDMQKELLEVAYKYIKTGEVDGIRLSTRPDCIYESNLKMLKRYGVTTIELGVQSLDDEVLKLSGRGHKSECVDRAVELIKGYGFSVGLQMMVGLPGDNEGKTLNTAKKIIRYKPDCVRIYPTVVVADSKLCDMYYKGEYKPLTVADAVKICAKLLYMFEAAKINVIRIGLMSGEGMELGSSVVAGAFHPSLGEMVKSRRLLDKILLMLRNCDKKQVVLRVSPKELSQAIGNKKENVKKVRQLTGIEVKFKADKTVERGNIVW